MSAANPAIRPPYRLSSERLVVRCWHPSDAPLLKASVDDSLDHLRPWMPWAHDEPQELSAKVELLRSFRGRFDLGDDFVYGIFSPDESTVLGGCGLHPRGGPRSLEIGYWIRAASVQRGYATEVVRILTRAAFTTCGIERLDIKVDPDNAASACIPRKLGFVEEARLRRCLPPVDGRGSLRDALLFTMVTEEFRASNMASFPLRAADCRGEEIPLVDPADSPVRSATAT